MNCVRCEVRLAEGDWAETPTLAAIRDILGNCLTTRDDRLVSVEEIDPVPPDAPDIALQVEVTVCVRWDHSEIVRDRIIEALLQHCQPEYDSMVEVEVIDA